jgi:OOP family OmpA-OmpF porin
MEDNLMRIRRFAFALLWIMVLGTMSAASAQANMVKWMKGGKEVYLVKKADNFLILYDRSGSMAEKYNGTIMTKLQAERKILLEKNATLPDMNWQTGIFSFTPGGQLNGNSLENIVEHHPIQQYEKKWFSWRLIKMPLEPEGATLLQQGLNQLDTILAQLRGKTVIFLFTDGQYSQVDTLPAPGIIARKLADKYDICFVVMDTGAEGDEIATINSLASVTPCSYKVPFGNLLGNPEWMTNALFEVVDKKPNTGADVAVGYIWENILFDFDKADIKPEYVAAIAEAGEFMRNHQEARVVLAGHTDNVGTREYNMKLSHRRASAVRDYLVTKEGIDAARITLSGFGYSEPVATNATTAGRALNRRVQGIITGIQ